MKEKYNEETYNHTKDRGNILKKLIPYLPPKYADSITRVRKFLLEKDSNFYHKDYPDYFLTIQDFQLYANLNPGWVEKNIKELESKYQNITDGFIGFSKYLKKWAENETKSLIEPDADKTRQMFFKIATQKIELINKSNETTSLQSIITTAEIPQSRETVIPEKQPIAKDVLSKDELDDKIISTILYLINDIRPSISKDKLAKLDSDILDVILK